MEQDQGRSTLRHHAAGPQQEDSQVSTRPSTLSREIRLRAPFGRVVSLVPSITETLILFGKPPIGRTSFCIEPKGAVETIPIVGGTKTPKLSRIAELNPDLVIANQEENRREDVEALERAGHLVWVTYPRTVAETITWMEELMELTAAGEVAKRSVEDCREIFAGPPTLVLPGRRPKVTVLIWKDPWMAVGRETYAGDLIRMAGGEIVSAGDGRYPVLTREEILAGKPDLLLLPSEPYPFKEEDRMEWKDAGRVDLFSGEDLFWFGPRMKRGREELARLISS